MGLRRILRLMLSFFDFKSLDSTLRAELPCATLFGGMYRYFFGILLTLLSSFALTTISILYLMVVYDSLSGTNLVASTRPAITGGFLMSSLIYFGLITFPFLFLGAFVHQGVLYVIMRVLGGKGPLNAQYYMTSYITLALGVASLGFIPVAIISIFLPCFNLFFMLVYIAMAAYLALYVQAKMLVAVHRIPFASAFAAVLLVSIGSLLAYGALQFLVMQFGLGPDFTATFSIAGINESIINVSSMPNITGLPNASLPNMSVITGITNTTNTSG
jgi:hypothetical protein